MICLRQKKLIIFPSYRLTRILQRKIFLIVKKLKFFLQIYFKMTEKKTVFDFETSSDEENVLIISKNSNSRKTVIDDILDENSNT
ncbi:hypothetical protein BpHYR1_012510 [Brachionus plicatilis]|uniref:Uncharacterized protein n=1 Tax=Brachionus plicatilis TaxID=10195 RepID=A0A3M7RCT0_BRAPC|nr:hypothetical protein BpHYR1_012510 [Brachionus plicatilis]